MKKINRLHCACALFIFVFLFSVATLSSISVVAEEDVRPIGGIVYGHVYGYDMYDELVPLSWATITVEGAEDEIVGYSSDGYYEVIVPGGDVTVTIEHPGYVTQTVEAYIAPSSSTGLNFYLERSNEPIPEYPVHATPIVLAVALLVVLVLFRRKS